MQKLERLIVESWAQKENVLNATNEILTWIKELNESTLVEIKKIALEDSDFWFYSQQELGILNKNRSFFQIKGLAVANEGKTFVQQPIIIQDEIGYLGILCKEIDGVLYFLMQAKIEPGNINKIQLSPTIQATKSNFTQKHGGKQPAYLQYFIEASRHHIVVDQIQSEQSSRFYKKRNRNIIICVDEEIEVLPAFKWLTLGQVKALMRIDNLVNMDTRTVLSCIPYSLWQLNNDDLTEVRKLFKDKSLFNSIFVGDGQNSLPLLYQEINNYKMFNNFKVSFVDIASLTDWRVVNNEFVCQKPYPFKVVFCDIAIEGREVKQWTQPLFEATGIATFGLMITEIDDVKKFLIKLAPEIGCFDQIELGPTIQQEPNRENNDKNAVDVLFWEKVHNRQGVIFDTLLSEEGGRFYHEQNRNILVKIAQQEIKRLPEGYFWVDYRTLNLLTQVNNCLNIQLRNLLSLLEV